MSFCSQCGEKLPNNAKFCPTCGNQIVNQSEKTSKPQEPLPTTEDRAFIKIEYAFDRYGPPLPILCQKLGLGQEIAFRIRKTLAEYGINLIESPSIRYGHACITEVYWLIKHNFHDFYHERFYHDFEAEYPRIFESAFQRAMFFDALGQWTDNDMAKQKVVKVWQEAEQEMLKVVEKTRKILSAQ